MQGYYDQQQQYGQAGMHYGDQGAMQQQQHGMYYQQQQQVRCWRE